MMLYQIHNPTRGKRIIYDGSSEQKMIVIGPGGDALAALAEHIAVELMNTPDDLIVRPAPVGPITETVEPSAPTAIKHKPVFHVVGHRGIGDNIHQRGPIKALMQDWDVYLETPAWMIYHDLVATGLKLVHMPTPLHAQRRQIERESNTYRWHNRPEKPQMMRRIAYNQPEVARWGSITHAMYGAVGLPIPDKPDFSMPVPLEWRKKIRQRMTQWNVGGKPILVYRPITIRQEWNGSARNPDVEAYHALMNPLRDKFFVVSVGFFVSGIEDIVGAEQPADIKLHNGELDFAEMAALWAEADLVFANAGMGPVLAQAVGTPGITIYGGRESYRTTERAGAHLAPTLGIDPDKPCDCHSVAPRCGKCQKQITLAPAHERIAKFIDDHVGKERKVVPAVASNIRATDTGRVDTLVFGTFYVDSPDRDNLTELWKKLHLAINDDCDFLAVDSQSPIKKFEDWTLYDGKTCHKKMYFNFPDNIGHLSRRNVTQGRDGWGRAFCRGLQVAIELGYSHVCHIEGDSLFRLKVSDKIAQMKFENAACFSTPVRGMRVPGSGAGWVETGLMMFSTEYLRRSNFIEKYNWPIRQASPTPEAVIRSMLGADLKLQNWKALRADKNQILVDNVLDLDLDWVTHQHNSDQQAVYNKFVEAALNGGKPCRSSASTAPAAPEISAKEITASVKDFSSKDTASSTVNLLKLNLGCGTNKLPGWLNHDADVDITKPLPWPSASASYIFIEHCVEHVSHKQAISFFKEAHRVLVPGGVLRVVVPSLEMIRKCDDAEYHKFTTKWQQDGPTKRGAMTAIIYSHGHEMIWSASLLEAVLFYSGFDILEQCAPGISRHSDLTGVEGHGKVIGERFNKIESLIFEATKAGRLPLAADDHRVAVCVGGSERWREDTEQARALCAQYGLAPEYFFGNDHIATFTEPHGVACSLHPDKVKGWLASRRAAGLPPPIEVWGHRQAPGTGITHWTDDWRGSTGLFMVAVARCKRHDMILLCGVPMSMDFGHFLRKQKWGACVSFQPGWQTKKREIAPYVRSLSGGWTEMLLGAPDEAWLARKQRLAA